MSTPTNPPIPEVPSHSNTGVGVRRHHTITAASRSARPNARDTISEEAQPQHQELWNDDEVVGEDWVGGVGAVGEKSGLHRQSSLPTKYHRGFQSKAPAGGNGGLNSLTAIAGHEGDEEEWEREIGGYSAHDEEHAQAPADPALSHGTDPNLSPLSPYSGGPPDDPTPPAAGVRRHVSLGAPRTKIGSSGLKRSGTLQTTMPGHSHHADDAQASVSQPEEAQYEYEHSYEDQAAYDEEVYGQGQYGLGAVSLNNRSSPWSSGNGSGNDWRTPSSSGFSTGGAGGAAVDDVQRALAQLELSSNNSGSPQIPQQIYGGYPQTGVHPPRFSNLTAARNNAGNGNNGGGANAYGNNSGANGNNGRKLQLVTEFDGRKTPLGAAATGSPYYQQQQAAWDGNASKERILTSRASNPNLQYGYQQSGGKSPSTASSGGVGASVGGSVPNVPPIPVQYLQQNQQRMGGGPFGGPGMPQPQTQHTGQTPTQPFANTPIDVPTLIQTKGYNPPTFDTRPQFARFFVIKSYTEDDVHKSLKYEIWSSTDPGNKRLDKAFKECAGRGPIYLFFSVNASGHFCGMAEMLTPVDYTRSSTVWASDKWKGVFKVRWIFVRDIPNPSLRHIKLNNTQERKPVTNSRDTQELLPEAGQEMLRIFFTHPARTSLLQDFAFYELQAMQKMQGAAPNNNAGPLASPPMQHMQPNQQLPHLQQQSQQTSPPQNQYNLQSGANTSPSLGYQMNPMMQMQLQMGMVNPGSQFNLNQTQQMHQSVMRHPSPAPPPQQGGNQNFMGY